MHLLFRRLNLHDLNPLVGIENKCFLTDHLGRRAFRRLLQSPSAHVIGLACSETSTVCAYAVILTRRNSAWWRLYSLAVTPKHQGQGLARSLLQHCLHQAKKAAAQGVRLEVQVCNHAAFALYLSCGFEVVDLLPYYYSDGADGYRMQLSFTP